MKNIITPYNPEWKTEFENLNQILTKELNAFEIDIQHVGSTAIPELFAKPILDIDIIINNKSHLQAIAEILERLGYKNKGDQGIPGRFAFKPTSDMIPATASNKKWQGHHLYVCFADSLAVKNHLLFRDALLRDNELVIKYSQMKMELVNEKGMTKEKYTKRKTEFIISVLKSSGVDERELKEIADANQ
jgi:GrpB-like predicted nucleotidyltransferase (UPF0157 family)